MLYIFFWKELHVLSSRVDIVVIFTNTQKFRMFFVQWFFELSADSLIFFFISKSECHLTIKLHRKREFIYSKMWTLRSTAGRRTVPCKQEIDTFGRSSLSRVAPRVGNSQFSRVSFSLCYVYYIFFGLNENCSNELISQATREELRIHDRNLLFASSPRTHFHEVYNNNKKL